MKKLFVFSDVHGESDALLVGLREAGFETNNPEHIPLCIGDLFDRGEGSRKLFDFMIKNRGIWIKGNHEIMLEEALEKGLDGETVFFNILHNGLDKTIASFANKKLDGIVSISQIEDAIKMAQSYKIKGVSVLEKLKSLPLYYETKNYIFVHAGLDPYRDNWKETTEDFMTWDINYSHLPISGTRKTVVIGHHHAFRVRAKGEEEGWCPEPLGILYFGNIDEHAPVKFGNKIAIDPCSNLTHRINILVIEDELLEEEKKEEVEQKSKEPTITISRGNINNFNISAEWMTNNNIFTTYDTNINTTIYNNYHL